MRALYHFLATVPLLFLSFLYKNLLLTFSCLFFGVLVDIDHLLHFYLNHHRLTFSFERLAYMKKGKYWHLHLHSVELIPLLIIACVFYPPFYLAVVSYVNHLLLDLGRPAEMLSEFLRLKSWWRSRK